MYIWLCQLGTHSGGQHLSSMASSADNGHHGAVVVDEPHMVLEVAWHIHSVDPREVVVRSADLHVAVARGGRSVKTVVEDLGVAASHPGLPIPIHLLAAPSQNCHVMVLHLGQMASY